MIILNKKCKYLFIEEIIEINNQVLTVTNELDTFILEQPDDLRYLLKFTKKNFNNDLYRKSLSYCITLIILHPFKNGNHRTSLLTAEQFLLVNNYQDLSSDEKDLKLQKWRIHYEEKYELEREFFRITCIEEEKKRSAEILKIMNSHYGKYIEKWLHTNFIEK